MYVSILEQLLDDENNDLIELQAEQGKSAKFEQIAVVVCDGELYAIMHPVDLPKNQVAVFKLNTEDEDDLALVLDEALVKRVLEIFREDWDNVIQEEKNNQ